MTAYPDRVMPIVEAFGFAVEKLNPIAPETFKDAESDDDDLRNRAWEKIDEQMRDVERPFRNALADRRLIPMVVGPDGTEREIVDDVNGRESWRQLAFGMPGFEATTHPITSPGPEEDRPIFVEKASFIRWFADQGVRVTEQELREYTLGSVETESEQVPASPTAQKKRLESNELSRKTGETLEFIRRHPELEPVQRLTRLRGRKPHVDWQAVEDAFRLECEKNGGAPGPEMGRGWKILADVERFISSVLISRKESAAESVIRTHANAILANYEAGKGR